MNALLHDTILVLAPLEADVQRVDWQRPSAAFNADSEQFCHDCGTMLGFLLAQNLPEKEVLPAWQSAISPT
jgi:hypothetical protein